MVLENPDKLGESFIPVCGHPVSGNPQKILQPELLFLAQICTKSFVGWTSPQTTLGSLQRSHRPPAVFRGPTSKGIRGEGKGRTGRERRGERGSREGEKTGGIASTTLGEIDAPTIGLHQPFRQTDRIGHTTDRPTA